MKPGTRSFHSPCPHEHLKITFAPSLSPVLWCQLLWFFSVLVSPPSFHMPAYLLLFPWPFISHLIITVAPDWLLCSPSSPPNKAACICSWLYSRLPRIVSNCGVQMLFPSRPGLLLKYLLILSMFILCSHCKWLVFFWIYHLSTPFWRF